MWGTVTSLRTIEHKATLDLTMASSTAKTVTLIQFIPEGLPMPEHFAVGGRLGRGSQGFGR
jgi:hypothetical protein